MPDLEMIEVQEVEAKITVESGPSDTQKQKLVSEQSRRLHSTNRIAERVAAAVEGQLSNGRLPA